MNRIYPIILLIISNVFMTFAWYGHLRLQQANISNNWPLIGVIVFSWSIAFIDNGGPYTLMQLKIIQEVISLTVFCVIANIMFQGQQLHWNHLAAMICLVLAVYFIFK